MKQFGFKLTLVFDDETRQVNASLIPDFSSSALSTDIVREKLSEDGFGDYFTFDDQIDALVKSETALREKGHKIYQEIVKRIEAAPKDGQSNPVTAIPNPATTIPDTVKTIDDSATAASTPGDANAKSESKSDSEIAADTSATEDIKATSDSTSDSTSGSTSETKQNQIEAITAEFIFSLLKVAAVAMEIAEQRDAIILISTSEDDLTAYLDITPCYGGLAADKDSIQHEIIAKGIKAEIIPEAIIAAIRQGHCQQQKIAQGVAPKKGKPSKFVSLVQDQISSGPVIDSRGKANYHDINQFVVVEPGDQLMRRSLPSAGKSGTDVFGKVIPAEAGDVLPFFGGIEGAEASPDDKNLLIATQKGHPIIHDRGVSVDPVLQLTNVSLATGNVTYDGSVLVKQDVADGLKIEVTGDVIVEGVVGKATIIAGNNVIIKQGLIGGIASDEQINEGNYGATITAEGIVSARFATMAQIRAGKKISLNEYASHCDLYAYDCITLGEDSGKGNLIGGKAEAFNLVSAKTLGSPGGATTSIRVGAEPNTLEKYRRVSQSSRQKQLMITDIHENLHRFKLRSKQAEVPPQMIEIIEKLNRQLDSINLEMQKLHKEEERLKILLMKSKKSKVVGKTKVYQNVIVHILGSSFRIKEDSGRGNFQFDQRQVLFTR